MIRKSLVMMAVMASIAFVSAALAAQTSNQVAPPRQSTPTAPVPAAPDQRLPAPSLAAPTGMVNPATRTDCEGGTCDAPLPHITIATPAPTPAPWPVQERIAWGASLLLTIVAYVGIMLALSALRKIERQARFAETAAQAAAESAKATLLLAQTQAEAQARAERPWILITVEAANGVPEGFSVVATNRGQGPAQVVSLASEVTIAADESQLPKSPEYKKQPHAPDVPMILLPGESIGIKSFHRDDAKSICETEERLRRVRDWEEKIFLYGNVAYRDLRSQDGKQVYESSWCCWYIHGQQRSGMVKAGPQPYNQHS